ncbi:MAG TPA: SMP-30/gluconolactonase/LRE family protein [Chloroflexia bacterium]|nr:SMP-30/gluconolactonase/LRE family protein [Chloroflexia bacterium]
MQSDRTETTDISDVSEPTNANAVDETSDSVGAAEASPVHPEQIVQAEGTNDNAQPLPADPQVTPGDGGASEEAARPAPLPAIPPAADLAPSRVGKWWLVLCFSITMLVYVAQIPRLLRFSSPPTGDQPFYLMDTLSLVQDGDLELSNNYAARDEDKFYRLAPHPKDFVGMSAPYPLPAQLSLTPARPPNEAYAAHPPGLSLLILPAWVVGSWFQLWWPATIIAMCLMGALLAVNVFLFAHEVTGELWIALAVWVPTAFSNPIMSYSYLIFTEMPTALLLLYAFRRLALGWGANGPVRLMLIGACLGYVPWMSVRYLPLAGVVGLYATVQWWRYRRTFREEEAQAQATRTETRNRGSIFYTLWFLGPIALSAALTIWFNYYKFGRLLPSAEMNQRGRVETFFWPWQGMDELIKFFNAVIGTLFDRPMGLIIYAPVYLLAIVGLIAMFRSGRRADRRIVGWLALLTLPYMFLIFSYEGWNGVWSPPGRYMTTFVPFLAAPLAMSLMAFSRSWIYTIIYGAFASVSVLMMGVLMNDPRRLWPVEREKIWDWLGQSHEAPFHLDLRTLIPTFVVAPDEVRNPRNTAWLLGGTLVLVLVCYFMMRRANIIRSARPLPNAFHGIIWLAMIAATGASWCFANAHYLQQGTSLVELDRWDLNPYLALPRGIAYLDNRIYVTDYDDRRVGQLELDTAAYRLIQPVTASGRINYTRPGSVGAGPDGMIYVLNNGDGDQALLVMSPNGELVRQTTLNAKGSIAIGLAFGNDKMYISDMTGGRVLVYPVTGGDALAAWTPPERKFNNPGGLAIDGDGNVYVVETSERSVHRFDKEGNLTKKYDLKCDPMFAAISGNWMEVSCGTNLISVNIKDGSSQSGHVDEKYPRLYAPTGLTFGPDGTLYVLDGSTVVAYRVQH